MCARECVCVWRRKRVLLPTWKLMLLSVGGRLFLVAACWAGTRADSSAFFLCFLPLRFACFRAKKYLNPPDPSEKRRWWRKIKPAPSVTAAGVCGNATERHSCVPRRSVGPASSTCAFATAFITMHTKLHFPADPGASCLGHLSPP